MYNLLFGVIWSGSLMLGMILFLELGRRYGRRQPQESEGPRTGLVALEGVIFALLGLMIAFTFSGASNRFDARRQLIVEEANAIGTAWLRLDLLPPTTQPELRDMFRRYLDLRMTLFQDATTFEAGHTYEAMASTLQGEIWSLAVVACQQSPNPVTAQVIPALNQMFDNATTRTRGARYHPPTVIYYLLAVLALMSSLLAGRAMSGSTRRSMLHILGFPFMIALTFYVIIDLEYPRHGFIRIHANDQVMMDLRQNLK